MNYAEDRLDRRARYSNENGNDMGSSSFLSPLESDLSQAYCLLRTKDVIAKAEGHELAGRTLRDCGRNREALFHYGQAWIYTHHHSNCVDDTKNSGEEKSNEAEDDHVGNIFQLSAEEKAVGDYAQMAEFNGVPELGILVLLYYVNGGSLVQDEANADSLINDSSGRPTDRSYENAKQFFDEQFDQEVIFVPVSIRTSKLTDDIISSFEELLQCMKTKKEENEDNDVSNQGQRRSYKCDNAYFSANTILDQIAKQNIAKRQAKKNPKMTKAQTHSNNYTSSSESTPSSMKATSIPINKLLHFWNSSSATQRVLSPLLQILLLKLLYVNPLGGPFLYLATEALYHLSMTTMPLDSSSSDLSKYMAKHYKSHWAYYVLIYKIVFGERIKKHRIQSCNIPYHVPLWDIVHGLDERKCVTLSQSLGSEKVFLKQTTRHIDSSITSLFNQLLGTIECPVSGTCKSIKSLSQLITIPHTVRVQMYDPIYALGDSHVLSIGWQTIKISYNDTTQNPSQTTQYRTIIPYPVTGLKAWHTRSTTKFFTYSNLRYNLQRLPSQCRTIVISTGEIDCREGIGGTLLQGYYQSCDDGVRNTVQEYIAAIHDVAQEFQIQILLLPVAPHAKRSEKNGKSKGRAMRRERMVLWNDLLRSVLEERSNQQSLQTMMQRVFLLDYEEKLRFKDDSSPVGFVLNPSYNADYTHMNSAFLPHLEASIERSCCDCSLL